MGLNEILLIVAALVPAIILCVYVYKKDRAEKEPLGILLGLLAGGAAICFPAAFLEGIAGDWIDGFFAGFGTITEYGITLEHGTYTVYQLCSNVVGVALIEEGLKWLVLLIVANNTKHFNSLFDGIIYAVFVSLGFAALENVLYVLQYGWGNAIMRGILSVPGHAFFGVIMGYYYSTYHMTKMAHLAEVEFKNKGILKTASAEFSEGIYLVLSLLVPVICHGFYNFCCSMGSLLATVGLYGFVIVLYIYCFSRIKKVSKDDTDVMRYVVHLLVKKYPELPALIAQNETNRQSNQASVNAYDILPRRTTASAAVRTTPQASESSGVKFAGIYASASGKVHIVVGEKQQVYAGATVINIITSGGSCISVTAKISGYIDRYDVKEGDYVTENKLLGIIKRNS